MSEDSQTSEVQPITVQPSSDEKDSTLEEEKELTLEEKKELTHEEEKDSTLEEKKELTLEEEKDSTHDEEKDSTLEEKKELTLAEHHSDSRHDNVDKDSNINSVSDNVSLRQNEFIDPQKIEKKYCIFFQTGGCRFEDSCFNLHEVDPEFKEPNKHTTKNKVRKKKASKSELEKEERAATCVKCMKQNNKMRTVMDVVHRIQWDEDLNPEEFVVGFLDRFDGLVEEDFKYFDWSDVTTVDDWESFCIPKHRVYYFKCKGEVVWDRRTRLDRIFESRQVKCGECQAFTPGWFVTLGDGV